MAAMKLLNCLLLVTVLARTSHSTCVPPTTLNDVSVVPSQSEYTTWSRVEFVCPEGYARSGPSYSYCDENNEWSPLPTEFQCLVQCKAPEVTPGVLHFPVGRDPEATKTAYEDEAVIQYACASGQDATLVGPTEATCLQGAWVPSAVPTCSHCSPPQVSDPEIVQVTPNRENYAAYDEVRLSCPDDVMYTAKGTDVTYCEQNGEWNPDPTKMTCHENCLIPERDPLLLSYPLKGTSDSAKSVYGFNDVIQNVCLDGKVLVGPAVQRCANGKWLPDRAVFCQ